MAGNVAPQVTSAREIPYAAAILCIGPILNTLALRYTEWPLVVGANCVAPVCGGAGCGGTVSSGADSSEMLVLFTFLTPVLFFSSALVSFYKKICLRCM